MMQSRFAALALLPAMLALASCSSPAEDAAGPELAETTWAASFIPAEFDPPVLVETPDFKLVPLGPDLVDLDYAAYMSSIEHLQTTFTRSTSWPREGITDAEAMQDMENEQARFAARESFAYGVLTREGSRELGSVYVSSSPVDGYDAVVRMWVTKAEYDAGFDSELQAWVSEWVASEWPFANVAYPGRTIDWETWDGLVAASESGQGE